MERLKHIKLKFINSINNWILGVVLTAPFFSIAQQNLILNNSFESLNCSPSDHNDFNCVSNWSSLNNTTNDIWLRFPNESGSGFFDNVVGSQDSYFGNAYTGIITTKRVFSLSQPFVTPYFYDNSSQSHTKSLDILGGQFESTLQKDKIYNFSFKLSVADKTASGSNWLLSNCLDTYLLTENEIDLISPNDYGYSIFHNESILVDTLNWLDFSSCFIAKGTEKYIAIGCIRDTNDIQYIENIDWGNQNVVISYVFLDEFKLYECDTCCLGEFPYNDHVNISNNPASSFNPTTFTIVLNSNTTAVLEFYDSAGRLVAKNEFAEVLSNYQLDSQLAMGVYHYVFKTSNGVEDYGKVLVSQ